MRTKLQPLTGWGRYPRECCELCRPERYADLRPGHAATIARGQGRSYGDAALNKDGLVVLTERINRVLALDETAGILTVEAGTTLGQILDIIVVRGWFLPVVPGTRYVSVGGAIAADIHGKNHHRDGSFGQHVLEIELIASTGERTVCGPNQFSDAFWATVGGMGLTGIIGTVKLEVMRIPSAYTQVEYRKSGDLDHAFRILTDPEFDDHYSVAWIDCLAGGPDLGRSIIMTAHHAPREELPSVSRSRPFITRAPAGIAIPFDMPGWLLKPTTVKAFNALYYTWHGAKNRPVIIDYQRYFFPLDALRSWNRLYGRRGFLQYQCVLPAATAHAGIKNILEILSGSGCAPFLGVLKRLGPPSSGHLSFPMSGFTLAMDIPMDGASLLATLNRIDEIVLEHRGRVYLAKDARLSPARFRAMYERYPDWLVVKRRLDPMNCFQSSLSRRLEMAP